MMIRYIIVHNQNPPFTVYSEVDTDFGSKPARNFVKECDTYEEAQQLIKRLENLNATEQS
jgi:hypothetical protein